MASDNLMYRICGHEIRLCAVGQLSVLQGHSFPGDPHCLSAEEYFEDGPLEMNVPGDNYYRQNYLGKSCTSQRIRRTS